MININEINNTELCNTPLYLGNKALRLRDYVTAISYYQTALITRPELKKVINNNLEIVKRRTGYNIAISENIMFDNCDNPIISIIIPIYGQITYTLNCLKSIQNNPPLINFEIIVVNDKSPDNSFVELSKVKGIKLLNNDINLGFIRSCNLGATHSKGNFLCFLNNDTTVNNGWLDALYRTFIEFPCTGLAGSKLLYPNGLLQEAGCIIWKDGSAWNFGRNQDPSLPIYNYAREVDYCSGASIMVPKKLFLSLGGFDEHYIPAYCEDSDLALKIRDNGYRVIYQPLSTIVHYEGITSGKDDQDGVKSFQNENMQKVYNRWKTRLINHQENGINIDNAKDRKMQWRVLVLDHCTPTPDQDSGSIDAFNIMILLREMNFQVTFIPEDNYCYMQNYTSALQRIGIEVLYAPYCTSVTQHIEEYGNRYNLVFIFRIGVIEKHLSAIKKHCLNSKILFHTVDLHHIRMMREAELFNDEFKQKCATNMKEKEIFAITSVDAATVISAAELNILKSQSISDNIFLLPFSRSIRGTNTNYTCRNNIIFVGGYNHPPNIDAVKYFVNNIMPILRKRISQFAFYIVGSNPPKEITSLASNDIIVKGYVEDLNSLLDEMKVNVAPLRYGAGIKGKIGGAMSVGLPSVATSVAIEGMGLSDGDNILVANDPESFANHIITLYNNKDIWNKISTQGLCYAESAWGGKTALSTLSGILKKIGLSVSQTNYPIRLYSPYNYTS